MSDEIKNAIVDRVLRDLGYQNCQYIAIDHDRNDPGHDATHDHDHLHIITNAVDFFGKYVRDSWERYKIQSSLRDVELEFGLRQIESSWEIKATVSQAPELTARISQTLTATLLCPNGSPNFKTSKSMSGLTSPIGEWCAESVLSIAVEPIRVATSNSVGRKFTPSFNRVPTTFKP